MFEQISDQRLGLPTWKLGRLTQLMLLATTIMLYSVVGIAAANSLFVSYIGAGSLPIAFIVIGLCSVPTYALFSAVVDRYSRPKLFRVALLISAVLIIGLRFLLTLDSWPVYYMVLLVTFFQWNFHNDVLYTNLLTDYFTTLEYKRYVSYIGIAQAVGMLLGGGLTALLSRYLATPDLLLCVPLLFAIVGAQLFYLENSQRRLDRIATTDPVGLIDSLKTFPDLIQRYPLILLLASSSFLLVIIYVTSEFLWFSIYGQNFSTEALTGFLGLMRILISLVQIVVLYGFTRPLLSWLGVARMNPVYPITTLVGLAGVALYTNLPSAILLHVNGDALYKGINLPVHQLNYNAVPREFIGRVRALSDGFIYAIGLTLAGCFLWVCHLYLSLGQITWITIGLTLVFLGIRLPMGTLYARGLEEMIRSDAINLDDLGLGELGEGQLPPQSSTAIRELLQETDRYTRIKGLELAASLGNPSQFFPEIQAFLPEADAKLRRAVVKLFSQTDEAALAQFEGLLNDGDPVLKATALEVLIANQYGFNSTQLQPLLEADHQEIQVLAAIASTQMNSADPTLAHATQNNSTQVSATVAQIEQLALEQNTAKAVARVVAYSNNRDLGPLLRSIVATQDDTIKQDALEALATLAEPGDESFAEIAVTELTHPEPLVRMAAFNLLAVTRCEGRLPEVVPGLGDPDPRIRQRVAMVLAAYGEPGLAIAREHLNAADPIVVRTAIAAIGQVRTKAANDILFDYISPELQQVAITRKWQQQIPAADPGWQPLAVAIADYHQRLIQKVLYVLSCMGYARTVSTVLQILGTADQQNRENAVEVLASLSHRRFILPLMPLLEQVVNPVEQTVPLTRPTPQWLRTKGYQILLEALESKDRWIRTGALIALAMVPSALTTDPDPFVQSVAKQIFPLAGNNGGKQMGEQTGNAAPIQTDMNRLLLLKNVALFKNLSLDELLLIDKALEPASVLADEVIFTEGSWGSHLYIIAEGRVQLVKDIDGEQRATRQLAQGQYFGEVALFDDAPRWDGAIAIEDCTLLKLEKNRFIRLGTQRPHIILESCRFLSQRLRETDTYRTNRKPALMPEEVR